MSIARSLAKIASTAVLGGKNAVEIIEAAGTVVSAANILLEQAKPLMEDVDMKAVAENFKAGANGVAKNAGNAVAGAAGGAANRAGLLFAKFGNSKDELIENLAQAKSEKELRKAIQEARQSVLENATTAISVSDLLKAKEKASAGIGPITNMPGCFVIATYKKRGLGKDFTDYAYLYIGKAERAADGIDIAISREGDPDVYADVKYKQNVHIFVYNCMPEELDNLYESLNETFSTL